MDIFANISPIDHRYRQAEAQLWQELSECLSERALIHYQLRVEIAYVRALARRGLLSQQSAEILADAARRVTPEEVYAEEARTQHNIRALVNAVRRHLEGRAPAAGADTAAGPVAPAAGAEALRFLHLGLTSMDVVDTANALRYKDAFDRVVWPRWRRLVESVANLAERESDTPAIGRTHGQYAVPITFGWSLAEYVQRLGERLLKAQAAAHDLRGKIAGAVGCYNAICLLVPDPDQLEEEVLADLGIRPSPVSTQIVAPEYVADLGHALVSGLGVMANLADDLRHLQRSEIAEVREAFGAQQVGSSTMPHKRNPWNSEHVKSLWKAFMPRMFTVYADQISEHQRDLTNSASARFFPELFFAVASAADRLRAVVEGLQVDREAMLRHLREAAPSVVAEPLYILLAQAGHPNAHEAVRRLTLAAESARAQPGVAGTPPTADPAPGAVLAQALCDPDAAPWLARLTPHQREVLEDVLHYRGRAAEKTRRIVARWREALGL
ncbi:MAG: adenylosuccinate lyase [Firmicutes bacterium]|nr:adenylosuccinate lyase [Bacillota bacterium]